MAKKAEAKKYIRPSWDEYFLKMAEMIGTRGTCDRGRSGCVIVREKRILTSGYVGSPMGLPHCDDVGHEIHSVTTEDGVTSRHCIRTAHAEQNAINNAARSGVALLGGTIYSKMVPCYKCVQSIVNVGIVRVVSLMDYHASKKSKEILAQVGVKLDIINNEVEKYRTQ